MYLSNAFTTTYTRGSAGSCKNLYFGDPKALVVGDRSGLRWEVSDAPNWATAQMDMRLMGRYAGVDALPKAWTILIGIVSNY